jgi:hypothetical protein
MGYAHSTGADHKGDGLEKICHSSGDDTGTQRGQVSDQQVGTAL